MSTQTHRSLAAQLHHQKALFAASLGNVTDALTEFDKAISVVHSDEYLLNKGKLLAQQERLDEAIAIFKSISTDGVYGADAKAAINLAEMLIKKEGRKRPPFFSIFSFPLSWWNGMTLGLLMLTIIFAVLFLTTRTQYLEQKRAYKEAIFLIQNSVSEIDGAVLKEYDARRKELGELRLDFEKLSNQIADSIILIQKEQFSDLERDIFFLREQVDLVLNKLNDTVITGD